MYLFGGIKIRGHRVVKLMTSGNIEDDDDCPSGCRNTIKVWFKDKGGR
ncbi:hypothetical protein Gogos_002987 [Gossypium gossypioides]|uniref:Uncharacterized protein n=1 Tax=Gossypium gossypioides TaxID=34282 RepID=A0A7J9CKM2_GOSGO|nr:hypothetical protein [Gossypium gossypioides]